MTLMTVTWANICRLCASTFSGFYDLQRRCDLMPWYVRDMYLQWNVTFSKKKTSDCLHCYLMCETQEHVQNRTLYCTKNTTMCNIQRKSIGLTDSADMEETINLWTSSCRGIWTNDAQTLQSRIHFTLRQNNLLTTWIHYDQKVERSLFIVTAWSSSMFEVVVRLLRMQQQQQFAGQYTRQQAHLSRVLQAWQWMTGGVL